MDSMIFPQTPQTLSPLRRLLPVRRRRPAAKDRPSWRQALLRLYGQAGMLGVHR